MYVYTIICVLQNFMPAETKGYLLKYYTHVQNVAVIIIIASFGDCQK